MPPIEIKLFHSTRKAVEKLTKYGVLTAPIERSNGWSEAVTFNDGTRVYIAVIEMGKEEVEGASLSSQFGSLAHEAFHLAMRYLEDIGEESPGEEEIAYIVQTISAELFQQHEDYLISRSRDESVSKIESFNLGNTS